MITFCVIAVLFIFAVIYDVCFKKVCHGCNDCEHCRHCDHYYCDDKEWDEDDEVECSDDCEDDCDSVELETCYDCSHSDLRNVEGHVCGWQICDCGCQYECNCWELDQQEDREASDALVREDTNEDGDGILAKLKAHYAELRKAADARDYPKQPPFEISDDVRSESNKILARIRELKRQRDAERERLDIEWYEKENARLEAEEARIRSLEVTETPVPTPSKNED